MAPGVVISGFRVDRLLGWGSLGTVFEATQLSLGRVVALRLLERDELAEPGMSERFLFQQRLSAAISHANLVPTYEAGEWAEGRFVATRFVRGRTLADLLSAGSLAPKRLSNLMQPLSSALEAAHDAGLVHGRLTAQNVIVDAAGSPFLADLGLGRPGSVEADRQALRELASQVERATARRRRRRLIAPSVAASAALGAVVAVVLLTAGFGDADPATLAAPALAAGAEPFGSALSAGAASPVGCAEAPGPNTPACTLGQATIDGRPTIVSRAGVIRRWAVRGAEGDLALQVVGRRGSKTFLRSFSQVERVADGAPHAFEANVPVERGDRIGVLLAPGASIGSRAGPPETGALRWEGTLSYAPQAQDISRFGGELQLRADIEPGGLPELVQESGAEARTAHAGEVVEVREVDLSGSGVVRVELVRVGEEMAIDAFRQRRRLARLDLPDVDPGGSLLSFESSCGFRHGFCLRWQNPDGELPVIHAYRLSPKGDMFVLIG